MTRYELDSDDGPFEVEVTQEGRVYRVRIGGKEHVVRLDRQAGLGGLVVDLDGKPLSVALDEANPQLVQFRLGGERLAYRRSTKVQELRSPGATAQVEKGVVVSPMPGKVISTLVKPGEAVKAGDPLVIIESMKMEVAVRSDRDADVAGVLVKEGAAVKRGQALVRLA